MLDGIPEIHLKSACKLRLWPQKKSFLGGRERERDGKVDKRNEMAEEAEGA